MAPDSAPWPCELAGAGAVVLTQPDAGSVGAGASGGPASAGGRTFSARLEPGALQDLVETLPDVIQATAGVTLRFDVTVTLGDGTEIALETIEAVNELLKGVSDDLCLDAS